MNLGHSVNLGVGMFLGFIVIQQLNINPILGAPFSFIFTGIFNVAVYLLFFHKMKNKNYTEVLIALFGLVFLFPLEKHLNGFSFLGLFVVPF